MFQYKINSDKSINYVENELINKIVKKNIKLLITNFNYKGYKCIVKPSFIYDIILNNKIMFMPRSFNGYIYYENDKILFFNKCVEWTYDKNKQLGFDHCHYNDIYITNRDRHLTIKIPIHNTYSEKKFYSSPEYVMIELKEIIDDVILMKKQYQIIKNILKFTQYRDLINDIFFFIGGDKNNLMNILYL